MTATGYNDYLSRLVSRITTLLTTPLTNSSKIFANQSQFPYLQVNKAQLAEWIDTYIRKTLFKTYFNPFHDENWRILLLDPVTEHINRTWAIQLLSIEETRILSEYEVVHRHLSEVQKINIRQLYCVPVHKCIYEYLRYPSKNGNYEKCFIEAVDLDSEVERFCKIDENKHSFLRLRYINSDGMPAFYHPDFLVKIGMTIYLVETKA